VGLLSLTLMLAVGHSLSVTELLASAVTVGAMAVSSYVQGAYLKPYRQIRQMLCPSGHPERVDDSAQAVDNP
jgi:hypothetical protein